MDSIDILVDAFEANRRRFEGMTDAELRAKRAWLEVEVDAAERLGYHDKYHISQFDLEAVNAILKARGIQ